MRDLRLGIIGSGGRGAVLGAAVHAPDRGARIVACCDVDAAVLRANRDAYGADIVATRNYQQLLACELDAVIVATPDFLHEEHTVAALRHGLTVFVEKPLALTIDGCDRILRTAVKNHARLYVGHNMRHMGFVQKMKELIDDGAIGEVKACWARHFVGNGGDYYFRDWHADRRFSGSLLLQKATHDFDVIHWLCGGSTRRVSAMGGLTVYGDVKHRLAPVRGPRRLAPPQVRLEVWPPKTQRGLNHLIDVEDLSQVLMHLDNGVFATYSQCHYTPDYWRSYVVIGTEGRIENFGNGDGGTSVQLWNQRRSGYHRRGDAVFKIPVKAGGHGGADVAIMAEFCRFVRKSGTTATSPLAARESVATACAATKSLRMGGVALDVPRLAPSLAEDFTKLLKTKKPVNGAVQPAASRRRRNPLQAK
jgi:Predicted dehydrogenases and related proteins